MSVARKAISRMLLSIKHKKGLKDEELASRLGISRITLTSYYDEKSKCKLEFGFRVFKEFPEWNAYRLDNLLEELRF